MNDLNRPLLGEPNASCRTCRAPLAEDQRYCLQCGTRRAEARLPFLDILSRRGGAAPAAVTETTTVQQRGPAGWLHRMSSSSAAIAGVACLLLALGIGVLIGGLGDDGNSNASTPQVISVGGAAPAAAPAAASSATPSTATPDSTATTTPVKNKKAKAGSSSSSSSGSKATNSAVKNLDKTSGNDYSKKSAKLPKTLGTGGKAPPKDNKPAAGGGSFEEIG
jgi:hypothetical protein